MQITLKCNFFFPISMSVPAKSLQLCPTLCDPVDIGWKYWILYIHSNGGLYVTFIALFYLFIFIFTALKYR